MAHILHVMKQIRVKSRGLDDEVCVLWRTKREN